MFNLMINKTSVFALVAMLAWGSASLALIEGADDRIEVRNSPLRGLASAVAIMVPQTQFSVDSHGNTSFNFSKLSDDTNLGLCPEERFANQPAPNVNCTGFLVAPDLLVTAGHCMINTRDARHTVTPECATFDWFFDYQMDASNRARLSFPKENHYRCKEVIYTTVDSTFDPIKKITIFHEDYALIRLDRSVVGRTPLRLAALSIKVGEGVSMLGYPLGVPMKYTGRARVKANDAMSNYFLSDLDVMGGNSGSPVFNSQGEVAGITVMRYPADDVISDPRGRSCLVETHCSGASCQSMDPDYTPGAYANKLDRVKDLIRQESLSYAR